MVLVKRDNKYSRKGTTLRTLRSLAAVVAAAVLMMIASAPAFAQVDTGTSIRGSTCMFGSCNVNVNPVDSNDGFGVLSPLDVPGFDGSDCSIGLDWWGDPIVLCPVF